MPDAKKPTTFEAPQPKIPGVPERSPQKSTDLAALKNLPPQLWAGGGAILLLVIALVWWAHGVTRAAHVAPIEQPPAQPAVTAAPPVETIPVAPGPIATTAEMKEPWSTKRFLYHGSGSNAVPALLVHLPGDVYWAISLQASYGTCELEFVTVAKLRSDYNLAAKHPMIGDPCMHTVYDLTRYEDGPNGLVRGAVVAGVDIRPPLAIEVDLKNNQIIASRIEHTP